MTPLIIVDDLTKEFLHAVKKPGLTGSVRHLLRPEYEKKTAVDRISFSIDPGESVAYVGPNGAGKSTTIKMLTGILVPTGGKILVNGVIPYKQRIENAKNIGAVFGQRTQLWWDLPVRESLSLLKAIYEIPEREYKRNLELFTDILNLGEFLHLPARKISLGQRMRADLAASLLHNPKVLYLDEPTIGLDVSVKARIRQFIKQVNQESGTTILLTTHDMEDIEDICKRLLIIDQGRVIFDGELQAVKDAFAQERTIHFEVRAPLHLAEDALHNQFPGAALHIQNEGSHCSIQFNRFHLAAGEIIEFMMKRSDVVDIHIDEPSIELVIRQIYESNLNNQRIIV
ncbi:ABC-2 type transport system ATP-binding protein [Paenibacillus forsythiae]|uniref:ABC-2 type transport system ATP-binding protein n=1 Tax=Paenibacillus forsythiae TaxID=365616 RepID=A0ABU3HAC3_9BACL|nr:ATP-binding cassette domain-containing protein [Paenibacillus forsythiae]MDT3427769.1 ABC-2 type transport system ATP-binding protein [Paenibacillus forsythiae]